MRHRKKSHGHNPSHERWIVSYADFVTLLFAFFVVMFATANADKGKVRAVSESVKAALHEGRISNVGGAIRQVFTQEEGSQAHSLSTTKKGIGEKYENREGQSIEEQSSKAYLELRPLMEKLKKQLHAEVQKGDVEVHMEPRGLAI